MGTSIVKTGGDAVSENRRAQLRSVANKYFEGLAKKDVSSVPWDDRVTLRSPLAPGGLDTPLEGKAAVAAWFAGLYPVLGEVRVIDHYINEEMTAICVEALVGITDPPGTRHVIDRFFINADGKITDQENYYDPRAALEKSALQTSADQTSADRGDSRTGGNIVDEASEESFPASDPPAY